tara:strand:+ start:13149 stop:13253 length:105 start_codon:yes stop_codon:yes gene_type:complete
MSQTAQRYFISTIATLPLAAVVLALTAATFSYVV